MMSLTCKLLLVIRINFDLFLTQIQVIGRFAHCRLGAHSTAMCRIAHVELLYIVQQPQLFIYHCCCTLIIRILELVL